jgi:glucose-6-phosphate 1-dehydrogenase
MKFQSVNMEFHYRSAFGDQAIPEAYERLLQDALEGDARLFIRSDQIEEAWNLVDPLLRAWEEPDSAPLHVYEPGSWNVAAADALLAQDGRAWVDGGRSHREGRAAAEAI